VFPSGAQTMHATINLISQGERSQSMSPKSNHFYRLCGPYPSGRGIS